MAADNDNLAGDVLQGAAAIARYTGFKQRTIYHLAATGGLPCFKLGDLVCARKSTVTAWIKSQETRTAG